MIFAFIMNFVFDILMGFLKFIPVLNIPVFALEGFIKVFTVGLCFVDGRLLFSCITCFVFFTGLHMTWAIIEWVYKKIPGVD